MLRFEYDPEIRDEFGLGCYCPIITCDQCNERIVDSGNALWLVSGSSAPNGGLMRNGQVWFTHKHCNWSFEAARPTPGIAMWFSMELRYFLEALRNNTMVTPRARRAG